ncbi:unnamed protein product, partial [Staurois parvus]
MRHCKIDSYKHDSQRQRHDGTCSLAGHQFDTPVAKLQVPLDIARLTVTSMAPKGRGMMGLVVSQQLEGHQFDTPA